MELVSVIIPNFNHGRFLEKRINSVLNQTYEGIEVIILDDNSSDNSIAIIEKYRNHPKVKRMIFNKVNSGSTFIQWKRGIEVAKGDWIWIAESDDFCEVDFLEILMKKSKESNLLYCSSLPVDNKGEIIKRNGVEDTIPSKDLFEFFRTDHLICTRDFEEHFMIFSNSIPNASAVVFRNKLIDFELILNYISRFKLTGDWCFWLFLLNKLPNLYYCSTVKNFFRNHEESVRSKQRQVMFSEYLLLFNFFHKSNQRKALDKIVFSKSHENLNLNGLIKYYFFILRNNGVFLHWKTVLGSRKNLLQNKIRFINRL